MINKIFAVVLSLVFVLSLAACGEKTEAPAGDTAPVSSEAASSEEAERVILARDVALSDAEARSAGAGTVVEKLSLTPLTDSSSYTVKEAVNYKWIAYDNYTVHLKYKETTKLAKGGYLLYIELPEVSFDHELYIELFASNEKVKEYSGEVAYTGKDGVENEFVWYSLPLGAESWTEHKIPKYKLCFGDGGSEFKGYIFIPADSFTYRYQSEDLSDFCLYVKTGVETGNGETGKGITFTVSTPLLVESFDKTTVIAQSEKGKVDLSKNAVTE